MQQSIYYDTTIRPPWILKNFLLLLSLLLLYTYQKLSCQYCYSLIVKVGDMKSNFKGSKKAIFYLLLA